MKYTGAEFFNGSDTERLLLLNTYQVFSKVGIPPISAQVIDDISTNKMMPLTILTNSCNTSSPRYCLFHKERLYMSCHVCKLARNC
jgi:hypothetical protein